MCDIGSSSSPAAGCINCEVQFGWSCYVLDSDSTDVTTPSEYCYCFRFVVHWGHLLRSVWEQHHVVTHVLGSLLAMATGASRPWVLAGANWDMSWLKISQCCFIGVLGDAIALSQWPSLASKINLMDPTVLCAYPFEYDNNVRITGMYLDNWGLSGTLPYSLGLYIYFRTFKSRKVYSVILIKINQYIKQFSHTEKNRTLEMLDNPKSPVGCTYACA